MCKDLRKESWMYCMSLTGDYRYNSQGSQPHQLSCSLGSGLRIAEAVSPEIVNFGP